MMASKRKPTKPPAEPKVAWERDQFSSRLTEARRALMARVAEGMVDGATPNDVLDRSLELAVAAKSEPPSVDALAWRFDALACRFDDLEEMIERMEAARAREAAATRATAAEALRIAQATHGLMSAVAAAMAAGDDGGNEAAPDAPPVDMPLRLWLQARAKSAGSVEAVGRWRSKERLDGARVAMRLEIGVAGGSARSMVRVEPIDAGDPLGRLDQVDALSVLARREGAVWIVAFRPLRPDRSLGDLIGEIYI